MFDSHAHLQDPRVVDPSLAWERARAAGVRRVVLAGVDAADWARQAALAVLPGVARSVGIHPQIVAALDGPGRERELAAFEQALAGRTPGVVAVGEIGMDGIGDRRASYDAQAALFEEQLRLAQRHEMPVILHILRAHEEALRVIERVGIPAAGGVVHSYSGSPELVPRYLEHGLYLSFSGSVTWHEAGRAARAVRACPRERLLVETDAPDQTPRTRRPDANEVAFLGDVVGAVAGILDAPVAEIASVTYENACRLFRLEDS